MTIRLIVIMIEVLIVQKYDSGFQAEDSKRNDK